MISPLEASMVGLLLAAMRVVGIGTNPTTLPPVPEPVKISAQTAAEAILAKNISFPLIVAPQYPLGPGLRKIVYRAEELSGYISEASDASPVSGIVVFQELGDRKPIFECLIGTE